MDQLHVIMDNFDNKKPRNQIDVESFLSARIPEIESVLKEISELFEFCGSTNF